MCLSMKPAFAKWIAAAILVAVTASIPSAGECAPRVVHVFVALADNQHQGIVPVPAVLGNGDDPQRNLYWGAAFGVKTFFKSREDWHLLSCGRGPKPQILERCIFRQRSAAAYLVADAYEGKEIKSAVTDFLSASAGLAIETMSVSENGASVALSAGGAAELLAYVGHDAFMDFQIPLISGGRGGKARRAIVLACASKSYFGPYIRQTGAEPLLWTTGLMAPEAYTLHAAVGSWLAGESDESVRRSAAEAYNHYQKCGMRAALRLFASN
jgi:hypothetical protein